ncbi:YopX family protein [Paenibacillus sp. FSL R5-0475]|uniref:YopX family protein n=1 Tax=Paenibacillus sp. FSL R5-0475 TaxID=2921643 RepID=UPI0030FBF919
MIREPKYRGYSIENKSWHYGFGWCLDGLTDECKQRENIEDYAVLYTESSPVKCDLKSMGEYTGLKDKNGREIYKGDVLDGSWINPMSQEKVIRHYKVTFDKGKYNAELIGHHPYGSTMLYFENENAEVIGTIYENPELIEV